MLVTMVLMRSPLISSTHVAFAAVKADGSVVRLDGKSSVLCQAGDALRLLSPGGGGFGQAGSGFAMTAPGGMQGVEAGEHIGHGAAGSLANYEQMQTSA